MSTHSQEYLAARGEAVKSTVLALSALVSWELTHSTDLLRFTRVERLAKMAFDLEASYGTRVADVDDDHHSLTGRVMTRIVPDHILRQNREYVGPGEEMARLAGGTGVRVCRPGDMGDVSDEERLEDARLAIREANQLIASARESLALVDPNANANTMAGAIEAEAQLTAANHMLGTLPPQVADEVINRVNNGQGRQNPHWEGGTGERYGAPYEEPPAGPLAAIAQQMPHMRPVIAGMEAAMAHLRPDPATQLANRLFALASARASLTALETETAAGIDIGAIDRQIAKTQAELDQLEADNVPDPKPEATPEPREIT